MTDSTEASKLLTPQFIYKIHFRNWVVPIPNCIAVHAIMVWRDRLNHLLIHWLSVLQLEVFTQTKVAKELAQSIQQELINQNEALLYFLWKPLEYCLSMLLWNKTFSQAHSLQTVSPVVGPLLAFMNDLPQGSKVYMAWPQEMMMMWNRDVNNLSGVGQLMTYNTVNTYHFLTLQFRSKISGTTIPLSIYIELYA